MRFIPDGPSIPDDLLIARDEGDVLFFCGAGISKQGARLPDFVELAKGVAERLGSAKGSLVRNMLDGAKESVPTDRVFSFLEREFDPTEVRQAVAEALKPPRDCDLSPHRDVLDLSRPPSGVPRLVTTNFDLLFEQCDTTARSWTHPGLPDPRREAEFQGIIHLHGKVNSSYTAAENDFYVLSSADFGYAYLADGWARRYIQQLRQRFKIMFIGYRAEDPPVQYLLEALSRFEGDGHKGLYAFQSGSDAHSTAQWAHKGVQPIEFQSGNYGSLWQTLAAWAGRARNVEGWYSDVLTRAAGGPAPMPPHERGMVVHMASSAYGAKRLHEKTIPLPAEWLCCFDPARRYAVPVHFAQDEGTGKFLPFEAYGLDSDPLPEPPHDNFHVEVQIPEGVRNPFVASDLDRDDIPAAEVVRFTGAAAGAPPPLPPRLTSLLHWFIRVAGQPAALWWAGHKEGLHPKIAESLINRMRWHKAEFSEPVRAGWVSLLASWKDQGPGEDEHMVRHDLDAGGWSRDMVRKVAGLYRPFLKVQPASRPRPPAAADVFKVHDVLDCEIEFEIPDEDFDIPASFTRDVLREFRYQLERWHDLAFDQDDPREPFLDKIQPEDGSDDIAHRHGLTRVVCEYARLLDRFTAADLAAARWEARHWAMDNHAVAVRLRIWSAGRAGLTDGIEAGNIILALDDESFWDLQHQPDLLTSLRKRWDELSPAQVTAFEARLLAGAALGDGPDADFRARQTLERLQWLRDSGAKMRMDVGAEVSKLKIRFPDWNDDSSRGAARPQIGRVSPMYGEKAAELPDTPLDALLAAAEELTGFTGAHLRGSPFRVVFGQNRRRSLDALLLGAQAGRYPEWAWRTLLQFLDLYDGQEEVVERVAKALAGLPTATDRGLVKQVADWLEKFGGALRVANPGAWAAVWSKCAAALELDPEPPTHATWRGWAVSAYGSPGYLLAKLAVGAPGLQALKSGGGIPPELGSRLDRTLGLPPDHRLYALFGIAEHAHWLHQTDPAWFKAILLPLLGEDERALEVFWAGLSAEFRVPSPALYRLLKDGLLAVIATLPNERLQLRPLALFALHGWRGQERADRSGHAIGNFEFRNVLVEAPEEFRSLVLLELQRYCVKGDEFWIGAVLFFVRDVWPNQVAVRNERATAHLLNLAFAVPEQFAVIVEVIGRQLVKLTGVFHWRAGRADDAIPRACADQVLAIMVNVLPDRISEWPRELLRWLDLLGARPDLAADARLLRLLRHRSDGGGLQS